MRRAAFTSLSLWLLCAAVLGGQLAALAALYMGGGWIVDGVGRPLMVDFFGPWSAGLLALDGNIAGAYDWPTIEAFQQKMSGSQAGFLPYQYPPIYLLLFAPLALLPYQIAYLAFGTMTIILYSGMMWKIVGRAEAVAFALIWPPAFVAFAIGQNGALTAALMGAAFLSMETNAALSGIALGLLTYKPHFGVLFPVLLALDQRWRVIAWACGTIVVLVFTAGLAFGFDSYSVFWGELSKNIETSLPTGLQRGTEGWVRLQSIYGFGRIAGAEHETMLTAQLIFSLACATVVIWIWLRNTSHNLKAASAMAGSVLLVPFVFLYDYPILTVALAFIYRDRPFVIGEWVIVAGITVLVAILSRQNLPPIGFVAPLMVLGIVYWRMRVQTGGQATRVQRSV